MQVSKTKAWYLSKTLWFNIIAAVVAIVGELANAGIFTDERAAAIFSIILIVGNTALRLITTQPVTLTDER